MINRMVVGGIYLLSQDKGVSNNIRTEKTDMRVRLNR